MFKIGDKVQILKEDCGLDIDIKNETGTVVGYDGMSYLLKLDNPPAPTFSIALDYVSDKADLLFVAKSSIKLIGRNGIEIGDEVKIVANENGEIASYVGLTGEVTIIDLSDNSCYVEVDGILGTWVDMDNVVKVETAEEVTKVEEIEFKIGDRVRIKGLNDSFDVALKIDGQTGEIVDGINSEDYVIKLDDPVLPTYDYCYFSKYESDKKDLYNAKLSQLELIGRNGIKVGDEVKVVTNEGVLTRISGAPGWFGTVVEVGFDDTYRIRKHNARNIYFWVDMEDIVKVEEIGNFEKSNFKIGDRVRIIKPGFILDFENETGTIVGYDDDTGVNVNLLKLDNPPVPTFSSAFDYTSDRKDLLFVHGEDIRLIGRNGIEIGDKVKIITDKHDIATKGDIVTVTGIESDYCYVEKEGDIFGYEVTLKIGDVIKFNEQQGFEIGDKVKLLRDDCGLYTGLVGEITEIDLSDNTCYVDLDDRLGIWNELSQLELIGRNGIEVGDEVKVITDEGDYTSAPIGWTGVVTEIDSDDNVCTVRDCAGFSAWVDISDAVKIDEIEKSEKTKFEVGDIIVANEYSDDEYNITNKQKGCVALVINNTGNERIKIRVVGHDDKNEIDEEYNVGVMYFDKVEFDFEIGDRVKVVSERGEFTYGNAIVGFEGVITEIDLSDYTCYVEGDSSETWVDIFDLEKIEFQVGDILEANYQSNDVYEITNEINNCTVKVLNVFSDGEIEVVIIRHRDTEKVGTKWYVDSKYFGRVEFREEFEEGDLVIAETFVDCDDILSNSNKCVGRIIERKTKDFFANHENIEVVSHINPDTIGETFFVPRTHIRKAHPEILVFDDNIMKTGRVAITRNGMRWLVIRDVDHKYTGNQTWALLSENGEFMSSDSYDDQARTSFIDDFDIMQVLQYDEDDSNLLQSSFFDLDSRDYVVWERGRNGFIC